MALIRCNECGGKVSDSAKICPHCGKEVNVEEFVMDEAIKNVDRGKKKRIVIYIGILIMIILCCLFVSHMKKAGEEKERRELYDMMQDINANDNSQ